jgi:paraquat-inducible protein B
MPDNPHFRQHTPMETAVIKTKKGISPIWILPIIAILIGAWLVYKDFQDSGVMITVQINDASGLTAGKTQVMFKGLPVGTLKNFKVSSDLASIKAEIEMVKQAKEELTKDSQFWVVRPEFSMNRITGLETLVSGSYFEIRPGTEKELSTSFIALDEPPPISTRVPGLHLILAATHSVALTPGSPIHFKKVEVGEVVSNLLQKDNSIKIKILIYPKFIEHVNSSSLFYISSGIQFDANLPKISLHIDPIKTIMRGGISFVTPKNTAEDIADTSKAIHLYPNHDAALHSNDIEINLTFSVDHELTTDSEIRFNGIQIGKLTAMKLDDDMNTIHAKAYIHQSLEHLLRTDTYIWSVNAKFNADGISNLSTLLKGAHLALIPGHGKHSTQFTVHDTRPANMTVNGGLNLVLETDRLGSLGYDKPIYYRQVQVGHTTGYELSPTGQNVLIYLNIHDQYVNLIRENTKFWNTSGFRIKGGLMTSMKISTESLAAIIGGGISFSTPDNEDMGNRITNGHHFILNNDPDDKWLNWSPALKLGDFPDRLNNKSKTSDSKEKRTKPDTQQEDLL